MSNINLTGKLAIVTGGGSGIGESTCQLLSELGASVVVVDINKDTADKTVNSLTGDKNHHLSISCDVSKSSEVAAVFDQISSMFCGDPEAKTVADILVNNAGLCVRPPNMASLLTCSEADWDREAFKLHDTII